MMTSDEDSTTPIADTTSGNAVREHGASGPGTEDDTDGHLVGLRRITDAGTDDDTEGNKLK